MRKITRSKLLMEGLLQLAGRDDRDLRADAREVSPEEILWRCSQKKREAGNAIEPVWNR
jgi:hypothetical protein